MIKDKKDKMVEDKEREKMLREARNEYLEILKGDPCLPKELLPENWYGGRVKKLLKI